MEEIVPAGEIDGDFIHVPGIFVDRVYKGEHFERKIARTVYTTAQGIVYKDGHSESWPPEEKKIREKIAKRAAEELKDGMYVNFGHGENLISLWFGFTVCLRNPDNDSRVFTAKSLDQYYRRKRNSGSRTISRAREGRSRNFECRKCRFFFFFFFFK